MKFFNSLNPYFCKFMSNFIFLLQANKYYRMFITWTNQKIRRTFVHRNMFDFKHIKPFDKTYIDNPGPMVVFATPGMLHAGLSLNIFKKWAPNENNMVCSCYNCTIFFRIILSI